MRYTFPRRNIKRYGYDMGFGSACAVRVIPLSMPTRNLSIEHEKKSLCRMPIMTTPNKLNKRYSIILNSTTTQSASIPRLVG